MTPFHRQWQQRRQPLSDRGWQATQRSCPTCGHLYTTGQYRAHLRSFAHRDRRGWWR